jgi:outer membrane protein OmpA-like peptidoglycan-associated protein
MKKLTAAFVVFSLFFYSLTFAQVNAKDIGIGMKIGEPLSLNLKYWMTDKIAICGDVGTGWGGADADDYLNFSVSPVVACDLLYHLTFFNLSSGELPLYAGLGLRYFLGNDDEDLGIRVPLGITYIFDTAPIDIFLEWAPTYVLEYEEFKQSAGIGFRYYFGCSKDKDQDGIKDKDQDGIKDKHDADPMNPEDFDGFQDEDGAPDLDNDNDGIPDLADRAPNDPEDKDGFQDEDGVPDKDNDNDGILDKDDSCPNKAEDFDNFEDEDGCPDLDNDKDGISDKDDNCPDEPETLNGYKDDDGCPDKKQMLKLDKKGAKLILKGINFKTNSVKLIKDSYKILNEVVAGLKDNPEVALEIQGHTDSIGKASYNLNLSLKRAQAVMDYLVQKGADSSRLDAVGYGEDKPIATNKTAEGRTQNRRIEFVRTK